MKRITAATIALVTVLLALVFTAGATTAGAQGPAIAVPSRTTAPADTSWGGCGGQCSQQP